MPDEPTPHILTSFDMELDQLRIDVIQMGNLALRAFETARDGVLKQSIGKCGDVIADDEVIDQKEKMINARGMSILLMYSPLASDFRAAVSTLSICRSLERIGDHAVNVAKSGRKIIKQGTCEQVGLLKPVFAATQEILEMALQAYTDNDEEKAKQVIAGDKKVDKLHRKVSKKLTVMAGGGEQVESILHLLFISRFLERIGDLASNIGEDVVFIHSAEDIRHA